MAIVFLFVSCILIYPMALYPCDGKSFAIILRHYIIYCICEAKEMQLSDRGNRRAEGEERKMKEAKGY